MSEPLDRVKAFLHRVRTVDDHFSVRFGCAEISIGDLRAVVEMAERLEDAILESMERETREEI